MIALETAMASASPPSSSRAKMIAHRERMRALGLRPVRVWVADVNTPAFQAEARRQALAVSATAGAERDQAFIDAVSDWSDE